MNDNIACWWWTPLGPGDYP